MENIQKQITSSFEVEAPLVYPPEKIYKFFMDKSITLREFYLKETRENSKIYEAVYVPTMESMSALDVVKVDEKYKKLEFKIIKINTNKEYEEILNKLMEEEKNNKYISYFINYDEGLATNYMKTFGAEGLEFINQDILKKQRSVLTYMIKQMGANILTGKTIMNVSLPIYIFEPRSYLEVFAAGYRYAPIFLEKASNCSNLEKLKLCTSFCIAIMSLQLSYGKPFNPLLGETFQAKFGDTELYLEQTSHHPPVLNYYIKNPLFTGFGYSQVEGNAGPNKMKTTNIGKHYLKFKDGSVYRLYLPTFTISGMIIGRRFINLVECMVLEDLTNNIISVLNFTREEKSLVGKLFKAAPKLFPDYCTGFIANKNDAIFDEKLKIYKPISKDVILSKFEGEWSNYINCDDVEYWKNGKDNLPPLEKMGFTLPSDSRYRSDVALLRNGYEEYSQQAKMKLEDIQREDNKLREKI